MVQKVLPCSDMGWLVSVSPPKKLFIPTPAAGSPARGAVNVPVDKIITTKFTEPIFPGNMLIELKKQCWESDTYNHIHKW